MRYQLLEQAIAIIKLSKLDQNALHNVTGDIVRELIVNGANESSLNLMKYLLLRLKRSHASYTFFSDTTREFLESSFKKDPSNLTSTFFYSLSVYEQSSNIYFLEKMKYSAWKYKRVVDEAVKEFKVYG